MKRIILGSLGVLVILATVAGYTSAQDTAAKSKKPPPAGTLSDEDVTNLKQQYTDPKTKKSYKWSGSFSIDKMTTVQRVKAKKGGKIPVRLTAALYEVKEVRGKKTQKRMSGSCKLYLTDAEGKVVLKTSKSLGKMCPT
jgi:hypothetical protein